MNVVIRSVLTHTDFPFDYHNIIDVLLSVLADTNNTRQQKLKYVALEALTAIHSTQPHLVNAVVQNLDPELQEAISSRFQVRSTKQTVHVCGGCVDVWMWS